MPTYIGFPLNIGEICRLFREAPPNDYREYITIDNIIENKLKGKSNISIYSTDKGQYILGYKMDRFCDVWTNNMLDIDDAIVEILTHNKKLMKELNILGIDMSGNIEIEYMEGDPEIVRNPKPRIITFGTY